MSLQIINTGTSPNAGNGDSIRTAFNKVNYNFDYLEGMVLGTSTSLTSSIRNVIRPMLVHNDHQELTTNYDTINNRIIFYLDNEISNINITNTATFKDVNITGTMYFGLIEAQDDFNITKYASDGSLNLRIKNTYNTGTSQINLLDNTTGSFSIVHQNSGYNSGIFSSGQNYIFDDQGRTINIGRSSIVNIYADSTATNFNSTPVISVRNSGTVFVNSVLELTKDYLVVDGRTIRFTNNEISINGVTSSALVEKLVNNEHTVLLNDSGVLVLPGNGTIENNQGIGSNLEMINSGTTFQNISPLSSGGSIFFDVSGFAYAQPSTNFSVGTSSFTLEWFQYQTSAGVDNVSNIFSVGQFYNNQLSAYVLNSKVITSVGPNYNERFIAALPVNYLNSWTHVVVQRSQGLLRTWVNGVEAVNEYTTSSSTSSISSGAFKAVIGAQTTNPSETIFQNFYNGLLTNVRFVRRELYNTSTITVPTSPLSLVTGTGLLLLASTTATFLTDSSNLITPVPGNIRLTVDSNVWTFTGNGNLTVPGVLTVSTGAVNIGIVRINASRGGTAISIGSPGTTSTTATNFVVFGIFSSTRIHEVLEPKTTATTTTTYDCSYAQVFFHNTTGTQANWTANLTNLNLGQNKTTDVKFVINQGTTAYYPDVLQISGENQTIHWQGNTTPTVNADRTDLITFTILRNGGGYTVLGQSVGF